MDRNAWIAVALVAGASAAHAQGVSVSSGPGGVVSGSVSMPGAPPVAVEAARGEATAHGGHSHAGPGESVTVQSADGRSVSSAWTSGPNGTVAGAGSPGSTITTTPPAAGAGACHPGEAPEERARTGCRPAAEAPPAQTQRGPSQ